MYILLNRKGHSVFLILRFREICRNECFSAIFTCQQPRTKRCPLLRAASDSRLTSKTEIHALLLINTRNNMRQLLWALGKNCNKKWSMCSENKRGSADEPIPATLYLRSPVTHGDSCGVTLEKKKRVRLLAVDVVEKKKPQKEAVRDK